MSIDRRIVSILFYNDIKDLNKIEKFIGENKEGYYEVMIGGRVEKLKIPGKTYESEIIEKVQKRKDSIQKLREKVSKSLEEIKDEEGKSYFDEKWIDSSLTKIDSKPEKIDVDIFEKELEETEMEKKEIFQKLERELPEKELPEKELSEKPKKQVKPKSSKKNIKNESKKAIDDDINDFIDSI